jgi:hypothetical protein
MQIQKRLDGSGSVLGNSENPRPYPSKAAVADHLDGLFQRLAAIGEGGADADAVQKVVGCDSLNRSRRQCAGPSSSEDKKRNTQDWAAT